MTIEEAPGRGQARVMGLIALAHGASHFYQLALPPLFPHLKEAFAVSYTELGTLMTVFYVSSGLSQTAAGFLVDRFSARTVLLSGLALLCVAIVLMGFAPAFWMLFPLAVLAGSEIACSTRPISPSSPRVSAAPATDGPTDFTRLAAISATRSRLSSWWG